MKGISKLTIARLLLSGALVGVALGNLFGFQIHPDFVAQFGAVPTEMVSGAAGATVAAVIFKLVHIL